MMQILSRTSCKVLTSAENRNSGENEKIVGDADAETSAL